MPNSLRLSPPRPGYHLGWASLLALVASTWVFASGCQSPRPAPSTDASALPIVTLTHDDTVIRRSCEIRIPPGTVIADTNGDGVLHIAADNVTLRFAPGAILRGAPPETPGDQLTGIGLRVDHHRNLSLVGARIHGFRNGVVASFADGLLVEGGDFSGNYRQRLRSTPAAEDGADWLFPHHNDDQKWRDEYGGAVCIESSRAITVRQITVRRGQNGILLDRVEDSAIYDNDCSFLSGWGLALWRSSRNVISRNALDFCVRGHVEGVYNRGQDSAGILCFEQSNENIFAENSVTHGGDGFFGFAGHEALGDVWMDRERERLRRETGRTEVDDLIRVPPELARDLSARGCNRNILIGNDFSYAPAHGIEMTFSEGNQFLRNRLVENAICGLWGGYSSDSLIAENEIVGNGGMAYGLERGGINMEHAAGNRILGNTFRDNKCAIHLWWDNDGALLKAPGVAGNYRAVTGNVIEDNDFLISAQPPFASRARTEKLVVLQLRDDGTNHVRDNYYLGNRVRLEHPNAVEFAVQSGAEPLTNGTPPPWTAGLRASQEPPRTAGLRAGEEPPETAGLRAGQEHPGTAGLRAGQEPRHLERDPASAPNVSSPALPAVRILGAHHPVGARANLRGRDQILLDEWGPWDHASPWVRAVPGELGELAFELFGLAEPPRVDVMPASLRAEFRPSTNRLAGQRLVLRGAEGVVPYRVQLTAPGFQRVLTGTVIAARWDAVFFPWKIDPRENLAGWRQLAKGSDAIRVTLDRLDLPYGGGGPRDLKGVANEALHQRGPGPDHFGMIARTRFRLPAGAWRIETQSDDGVRVKINGQTVIENWTWHGPTKDEGHFRQNSETDVAIEVEHFEIDGYATLQWSIARE